MSLDDESGGVRLTARTCKRGARSKVVESFPISMAEMRDAAAELENSAVDIADEDVTT
jgi:hypothetical protein